jgi:hypothetical protein
MLLSLDPGRQGFGWGALQGRGLLQCNVVPQPKKLRDYQQVDVVSVALAVEDSIRAAMGWSSARPPDVAVVLERMVHYPPTPGDAKKIKQDERTRTKLANDLLDLNLLGGLVARAFSRNITVRYPRDWKGTTDTTVLERRLLEGLGTVPPLLDERERALMLAIRPEGLRHNAVDAVAMGLGETGRVRWV